MNSACVLVHFSVQYSAFSDILDLQEGLFVSQVLKEVAQLHTAWKIDKPGASVLFLLDDGFEMYCECLVISLVYFVAFLTLFFFNKL